MSEEDLLFALVNHDTRTAGCSRQQLSASIGVSCSTMKSLLLFSKSKLVLASRSLLQSFLLRCQKLVFLQPHRKHNVEMGSAADRAFTTPELLEHILFDAYVMERNDCNPPRIRALIAYGATTRQFFSDIQRIASSFSIE
jgi:hypothetical protein